MASTSGVAEAATRSLPISIRRSLIRCGSMYVKANIQRRGFREGGFEALSVRGLRRVSGCHLDNQPVAPAILRVRQRFDRLRQLGLVLIVDEPRRRVESMIADSDAHVRIGADVLHPVGALAVLG